MEARKFIRIALETGSQIIPCFCFGDSEIFQQSLALSVFINMLKWLGCSLISTIFYTNGSPNRCVPLRWAPLSKQSTSIIIYSINEDQASFSQRLPHATHLLLFFCNLSHFAIRVPLLTVIGRSIPCPKIQDPSLELVNEYYTTYMVETKRIYDTYKNMYGWRHKRLVIKGWHNMIDQSTIL